MQAYGQVVIRRSQLYVLVSTLLCGLALVSWFLLTDAAEYLQITPDSFTSYYWTRRFGLLFHIAGGTTALMSGLVSRFGGES
jgi:hypothetical protein